MFWPFTSVDRTGGDGLNRLPDGRDVHLALYKYDSCPYCQRVYGPIDRLGVHVAYRDIRTDPDHRRALYELTGRTMVPCLLVDGEPMFESRDIMAWLDRSFGQRAAS